MRLIMFYPIFSISILAFGYIVSSWDNPSNCNISPAFNFNITVLVKVYLLFVIFSIITGPSFSVSNCGIPLTNNIALKFSLLFPWSTPSNWYDI